ncbi:histidinol-phosphatase (PHP family) [Bacillus mesophilus]|uniref:Histidinol-phosphatase n=1 Tax=Bacillus mesophilus TaxID=1808955 RepID=A0A6M0QA37_9BACI|nr:histidinol-phosphatase HisJ [Bacillus mesophilus]MBM7660523.1 histidinol-phosphatase (PHP family) [Bacillus mesophilus]NEY71928.1 histidinol-phosphatase HisJ [Bacillus mesophilus]
MIADGHIHTPFCPHGTKDSFEHYIEKAIGLGFKEISFTEHAPLPINFNDPTPLKDSSMRLEHLDSYFETITQLKERYSNQIKINRGLEVDYIEGYEDEIRSFLLKYGPLIDDSILSVHFLKKDTSYYCMDYSPDAFGEMITIFGSVEHIYKSYYETVLKSIHSDLGLFKPKRIGHLTLAHKFQKKFPVQHSFEQEIREILVNMKEKQLQLDYNGAGINKPLCKEPYPPHWVIKEAITLSIPLVYGSDAHQVKDLHQGIDYLYPHAPFTSPTSL